MKEKLSWKFFTSDDIRVVILSIVSSVIVLVLIEPAIRLAQGMGKGIIKTFQNFFYYQCANSLSTAFSDVVSLIFFVGICCVYIAVLWGLLKVFYIKTKLGIIKKQSDSNIDETELASILNKTEKSKTLTSKKLRMIATLATILVFLLFIYIVFYIAYPVAQKNNFDLDLIKISPYVSEEKIFILRSDWTQMQEKSDYDRIYDFINETKSANKLH